MATDSTDSESDVPAEPIADTEDVITYNGPPEPIRKIEEEDGEIRERLAAIKPQDKDEPGIDGNTGIKTIELGKWECQRCGTTHEIPSLGDLGDIPEAPSQCDGCEREGPFTHVGLSESEVEMVGNAPDINWYLPTGVGTDPEENTDAEDVFPFLWDEVREFIHNYWDSEDPEVYDGLTAYVLSTWVRENLDFVPHLMLLGKTTGGKTRLLNTLTRISYRAINSASVSPASMFRMIDGYDVTFYVSEYHGLEYETQQQVDSVIRAAQKRGELITRAEQKAGGGYLPKSFDPFTHAAVATQYDVEDDIKNRCVQVQTQRRNRDMPATFDEEWATEIRNLLLYARFRLLESEEWEEAQELAYEYMAENDIKDRTREKLLPLVTAAYVWDKLDVLRPFIQRVIDQDKEARSESEDAEFTRAVKNLAQDKVGEQTQIAEDSDPWALIRIPYGEIVDEYLHMTGEEKSPSWVGHVRKRLGFEKVTGRDGSAIQDEDLRLRLQDLIEDHNLKPLEEKEGTVSQNQSVNIVFDIVEEYESRNGEPIPREELERMASQRGVKEDKIGHTINRLERKGELYEPQSDMVRSNR